MNDYQNITIFEYLKELDQETVPDTPPVEQCVDEQGEILPVLIPGIRKE